MRACSLLVVTALACAAPSWATAAAASISPDLLDRIDAFVDSERSGSRIPGAALAIVHDGRIVAVRSYGSRGGGVPVTAATAFPIGSLTKSFTAVLVRQLVDAGRVEVDAPVQRYLPWFTLADAQAARQITVRHLLNQTSGLSRADGMRAIIDADGADIDTLARRVTTLTPTAAPGERYQYSNLNYVLLGALVQAVEGKTWSELVRLRILEPLDMQHSGSMTNEPSGLSAVHRYVFGVPVATRLSISPGLAPTGALVASADNMARYLAMMLQGGQAARGPVLSTTATTAMLTPASPPGASALLGSEFRYRYAEGWFVGPFGAAPDARWHLGNLASFAAWMVLLPEQRLGVVVLLNANSELPFFEANSAFSRIPVGVVNLLAGQPTPAGPGVQTAYAKLGLVLAGLTVLVGLLGWLALRARRAWPAVALASAAAAAGSVVTLGALGWRGWLSFAPDLAAWLAFVLGLSTLPLVRRLIAGRNWVPRRRRNTHDQ